MSRAKIHSDYKTSSTTLVLHFTNSSPQNQNSLRKDNMFVLIQLASPAFLSYSSVERGHLLLYLSDLKLYYIAIL